MKIACRACKGKGRVPCNGDCRREPGRFDCNGGCGGQATVVCKCQARSPSPSTRTDR